MSQSTSAKLHIQKPHRTKVIFLSVTVIVATIGLVAFAIFQVNSGIQAQQEAAALQGKPVTNVTQIKLVNYSYQPASIQVKIGTTVTWTNEDGVGHSVTFDNTSQGSEVFPQTQVYRYTFTRAGVYQYHCTPHPHMKGKVTVVA